MAQAFEKAERGSLLEHCVLQLQTLLSLQPAMYAILFLRQRQDAERDELQGKLAWHLFLLANIVTTSKALVTTSVALVSSNKLWLLYACTSLPAGPCHAEVVSAVRVKIHQVNLTVMSSCVNSVSTVFTQSGASQVCCEQPPSNAPNPVSSA